MDVMVLIDSFKGSMTSMEAGMRRVTGQVARLSACNDYLALADGRRRHNRRLIEGLGGRKVELSVTEWSEEAGWKLTAESLADERPWWLYHEMARSAGITLVEAQRNQEKPPPMEWAR